MNIFSARTVLFYTTTLVAFAINVNADRLSSGEIKIGPREGQKRLLRSDQIDRTEGKELQIMVAPEEIDVDPLSTYNENFMALMSSPCRPEYDGFFGATSGDPIQIQYGFKVEVQPLSAIMDILDAIEDKIVDSILQSTFPEMCGLRPAKYPNRSLVHDNGHPSGFRFFKFEEVEKCLPQENEVNFCGIFTSALYVYGKIQDEKETSREIISYINGVLETSEPRDLHSELTLLSKVDELSEVEGGDTAQSSGSGTNYTEGKLSRLDLLLIIISVLLLAAVIYYIYIQRNERRHNNPKSTVNDTGDSSSNIGVGFEGNDDEDKFVDEDLEFKPYRDSLKSGAVLH